MDTLSPSEPLALSEDDLGIIRQLIITEAYRAIALHLFSFIQNAATGDRIPTTMDLHEAHGWKKTMIDVVRGKIRRLSLTVRSKERTAVSEIGPDKSLAVMNIVNQLLEKEASDLQAAQSEDWEPADEALKNLKRSSKAQKVTLDLIKVIAEQGVSAKIEVTTKSLEKRASSHTVKQVILFLKELELIEKNSSGNQRYLSKNCQARAKKILERIKQQ